MTEGLRSSVPHFSPPSRRTRFPHYSSVSLSSDGTRALAGAPHDSVERGGDGSALVFLRMNGDWTEEAKLSAFDPASSDNMGWAVSLSADASVALVGIYGDDTERGLRAGSARAFVRSDDTWTEEVTLLPSNGVENDWFGRPLALAADGTRAIVSSTQHETAAGPNAGSAYVFSIMPGASSGGSNGSGGSSAIDGGAGAPGASDGSGGSGGDRGSTGTTGGAAGESSNDTVHAKTGNDGGCGCRLAPARGRLGSSLLTGLLLAVLGFRRRLRPAASQRLAHKRR